ncbi:hypothetical protein ACJMK2_008726, partial [Sinanodonta woodiana]
MNYQNDHIATSPSKTVSTVPVDNHKLKEVPIDTNDKHFLKEIPNFTVVNIILKEVPIDPVKINPVNEFQLFPLRKKNPLKEATIAPVEKKCIE